MASSVGGGPGLAVVTFGPFCRSEWRVSSAPLGRLTLVTSDPMTGQPTADPDRGAAIEALSDAIGVVAGVLDLEAVLQLIVDRVRALVGARYAALGIVADDRRHIERFITSGITAEQRRLLGPLPEGHGLLGLIISEGHSLRIPDIAAHPASYGFPPNHPPMKSLLGVPVRLKNRIIGNLYLTDKTAAPDFQRRRSTPRRTLRAPRWDRDRECSPP